jgi:hypothetical protein
MFPVRFCERVSERRAAAGPAANLRADERVDHTQKVVLPRPGLMPLLQRDVVRFGCFGGQAGLRDIVGDGLDDRAGLHLTVDNRSRGLGDVRRGSFDLLDGSRLVILHLFGDDLGGLRRFG